jgi:hypothetical protein
MKMKRSMGAETADEVGGNSIFGRVYCDLEKEFYGKTLHVLYRNALPDVEEAGLC